MVFLHGWGLDYKAFFYLSSYLTDYKCVYISLLENDGIYKLDDYANEVEKIINKEKLKNITIVGHSFGGRIAIMLATRLKIKGLVLIDSAGIMPKMTFKRKIKILDFKVRKFLKLDTSKCGSKDYINLSSTMKQTFKNIINLNLEPYLNKIVVDTLIVWGRKDKETPKYMAYRIKKKIKSSSLIFLDGDHFAYVEDKRFPMIIKSYLDGVYA